MGRIANERARLAGGLRVTESPKRSHAVRESGVRAGICTVYSPHTTCSVRVNEWERGFLEDFAVMLCRLVPPSATPRRLDRRTTAPKLLVSVNPSTLSFLDHSGDVSGSFPGKEWRSAVPA
jgi:hypothetical protein